MSASRTTEPPLEFHIEFETDDYATQRGLEQMIYDANPQAQKANGGYNKIRPISPRNKKKRDKYMNAAQEYLNNRG